MRKIIILTQIINGNMNDYNVAIDAVFSAFNETFKAEDDVICEFYVYNVKPSDLENSYKIKELKTKQPNTIHKIVISPNDNNEISFIDTGHPDILSAISALSEDEIKQSYFLIDNWCDFISDYVDSRTPEGGLATYDVLKGHLLKTTRKIFTTRLVIDDYLATLYTHCDLFEKINEQLRLEGNSASNTDQPPREL